MVTNMGDCDDLWFMESYEKILLREGPGSADTLLLPSTPPAS